MEIDWFEPINGEQLVAIYSLFPRHDFIHWKKNFLSNQFQAPYGCNFLRQSERRSYIFAIIILASQRLYCVAILHIRSRIAKSWVKHIFGDWAMFLWLNQCRANLEMRNRTKKKCKINSQVRMYAKLVLRWNGTLVDRQTSPYTEERSIYWSFHPSCNKSIWWTWKRYTVMAPMVYNSFRSVVFGLVEMIHKWGTMTEQRFFYYSGTSDVWQFTEDDE